MERLPCRYSKKLTPMDNKLTLTSRQIENVERALSAHDMVATSSESDYESDVSCCYDDVSVIYSEDLAVEAPLELLEELLHYVRKGNWEAAKRCCYKVLLYEPDNCEALEFRDIIDEKLQAEKDLEELACSDDCQSVMMYHCPSTDDDSEETSSVKRKRMVAGLNARKKHKDQKLKSNLIFSDKDGSCSWCF